MTMTGFRGFHFYADPIVTFVVHMQIQLIFSR